MNYKKIQVCEAHIPAESYILTGDDGVVSGVNREVRVRQAIYSERYGFTFVD